MAPGSIAIIGAGFSGTLLALQLLRHTPDTVSLRLIERSGQFGPGLAYRTPHDGHLLNVPAGRMSAFPDRETDFLDWLRAHARPGQAVTAGTFAPRSQYGAYIRDRLSEALCKCPVERLNLVHDSVVAIEDTGGSLTLRLASGEAMRVDAAVLASGNFPSEPVGLRSGLATTEFCCRNPWSATALAGLDRAAGVLLLGCGLTMVDTVISLLDQGHIGPIHAVSRRGLLSRAHPPVPGTAPPAEDLPPTLRGLMRRVRRDAVRALEAGGTWQTAIDALRPHTQALWQGLSLEERRRFLRHLRPFWDVHRHRMAPEIAHRIAAAQASGQLRILAGRVEQHTRSDDTVIARISLRGGRTRMSLCVTRVISCTGAATDITRIADPLLRDLLNSGTARPDALRLGVDVTQTCAVRAADGSASGRLLAIGPLTKGIWWEIVAVPDIRTQCVAVARHLAGRVDAPTRDGAMAAAVGA